MSAAADNRTLREALEETYRKRWAGTRSEKTLMSQAEAAAIGVARAVALDITGCEPTDDGLYFDIADVQPSHIRRATSRWYAEGLSPATINKRLNCLSAMGVSVCGCRVKEPKVLKWWLRPEDLQRIEKHFDYGMNGKGDLIRFIRWTSLTGLRVEETLRLQRDHFNAAWTEVLVPGTKTANSHATLAIGKQAASVATAAYAANGDDVLFFYPKGYEHLKAAWVDLRKALGWERNPTCTLKSLRRSAARYLHYDCGMPLDMVRQYLRHENIETTMGYLRLTGGISIDEQRRYLT